MPRSHRGSELAKGISLAAAMRALSWRISIDVSEYSTHALPLRASSYSLLRYSTGNQIDAPMFVKSSFGRGIRRNAGSAGRGGTRQAGPRLRRAGSYQVTKVRQAAEMGPGRPADRFEGQSPGVSRFAGHDGTQARRYARPPRNPEAGLCRTQRRSSLPSTALTVVRHRDLRFALISAGSARFLPDDAASCRATAAA